MDSRELLKWYVEAGADEAIGEVPVNRYHAPRPLVTPKAPAKTPAREVDPAPAQTQARTPPPRTPPPRTPSPVVIPLESPGEAAAGARDLAAKCATLEALRDAMAEFQGCALRKTAKTLVFADGNPDSGLMLVGEAPGAEEDRQGLPFVGASGHLLDRMLAAIGRDRTSAYISNILPWRPPGNRKPTPQETMTCLPFIERHIELARPRVLVFLGGTATASLLRRKEGITKLRGGWLSYSAGDREIPVMPTYHPAYLLRQPALKRESWRDLLEIKKALETKQ